MSPIEDVEIQARIHVLGGRREAWGDGGGGGVDSKRWEV